jgi:hypothetical protein
MLWLISELSVLVTEMGDLSNMSRSSISVWYRPRGVEGGDYVITKNSGGHVTITQKVKKNRVQSPDKRKENKLYPKSC